MSTGPAPRLSRLAAAALLTALLLHAFPGGAAVAQQPAARALAVLPVQFNGEAAVRLDPGDEKVVEDANAQLLEGLQRHGGFTLLEPARVAEAVVAQNPGPEGCRRNQCILGAGGQVGADLVLATVLTKLSNLIWFADASLLDVRTGQVVHREHLELKGAPADIVRGGIGSLARRMSEAARAQPR